MFAFIGNIGPWELIIILLIAVVVVGPGKLPDVARSMGKALNEFRRTTSGVKREFEDALNFEDPPPKTNIKKENKKPSPTENVENDNPIEPENTKDEENKSDQDSPGENQ